MVSDKYRASGWNDNINLLIYFQIILSGIGIAWLALNDVPSGIRYITIFLVGVAFLFISFFFINESQREIVKKIVINPFSSDYAVASGMYLFGWLVPIVINLVFGIFKFKFNISQLMIPLSASPVLSEIGQTFSVAEAQSSPFWQWFITVFTAGSIEEFVFGFVLMIVGVMIGMMIWRLITNDSGNSDTAKNFYVLFGIVFTGLIFGGAHLLNNTYVGFMFIVAIIFRAVMNYGIYVLGIFLSFTIGYHQSNNAVWYWGQFGSSSTLSALFSAGGIIILIYFALVILFVFRNIDVVFKRLGEIVTRGR